jgi:hypothetical protein
VLIPGVVESKSNFVEHPEQIAYRIGNYAKLVGRENVIAGAIGDSAHGCQPANNGEGHCRNG